MKKVTLEITITGPEAIPKDLAISTPIITERTPKSAENS